MRSAGILLAVSSLPSNQGVGDFGRQAYHFINQIADIGFRIWQILPFHPLGYGNSPYQPYSSYAGDEIYINIDRLADYGLIKQSSVRTYHKFEERVDFEGVRQFKQPYFKKAFREFKKQYEQYAQEYEAFCEHSHWLDVYAVFITFKKKNHMRSWQEWSKEERNWIFHRTMDISAYEDDIAYEKFLQFIFYKQWKELKQYANEKGIQILGDIPFYVGIDSADVWEHQQDFLLDQDGHPIFIAGVPPDYFSETGQRWGNPIYNWDVLKKENYKFWMDRLRWNDSLFDIIRIDHFRAFDSYWKIPAACKTAVEGQWMDGPSYDFFDNVFQELPQLHIVAEDLGDLRESVLDLRDHYQLYGMRILQFGLDNKILKKGVPEHVIFYTGTHDNDTLAGFYDKLPVNKKAALRRFFHKCGYEDRSICDLGIRYCLDSKADLVILPVQDILCMKQGRMNVPSTIGSPNWEWKLKNLKELKEKSGKLNGWLKNGRRI